MALLLNKINIFSLLSIGICLALTACDVSKSTDPKQQDQAQKKSEPIDPRMDESSAEIEEDEGKKLSDVAGQAVLPASLANNATNNPVLSEHAQAFVGRYHTEVNCEDAFAMCDHGKADFIINLLPDGTAHRIIIYMGKMTYENREVKSTRSYRKNTWMYDEAEHEIVVLRKEGVKFYYKIDAENNLVMDLDKILTEAKNNPNYFNAENPPPSRAYVLKRFEPETP